MLIVKVSRNESEVKDGSVTDATSLIDRSLIDTPSVRTRSYQLYRYNLWPISHWQPLPIRTKTRVCREVYSIAQGSTNRY